MPYASYPYLWSNTTTAPPAAGEIRVNNGTQTAATILWPAKTDSAGASLPPVLATLDAGMAVRVIDAIDGASYQWFDVTGPTVSATGYLEIPVAWNSGGNTVKNNRAVNVTFVAPAQYTGSAYATVDQLAAALRVRVTDTNRASLQRQLDAGATAIDQFLDRGVDNPLPDPTPANITEANINIGVELAKAADAAFGVIGYGDISALHVSTDAVARQAALLMPHKTRFGVA